MADRLTPLDSSFLEVETSSAHMHVGWAAVFDPPEEGARPSFEQLRYHIARRLRRAPRYRQRLAPVPLGVARPVWVDDEDFDVRHHVRRANADSLAELADAAMSTPLARERPLWEIWIAENLDDGRVGVVGKAHHCMVDGIAAVELAVLLLDGDRHVKVDAPDQWAAAPPPSAARLVVEGLGARVADALRVLALPARLAGPDRLRAAVERAGPVGRALAHSLSPAPPASALHQPSSPYRHLATSHRSMEELRRVTQTFGTTINDVVLAAAAGAVRRLLQARGETPVRLKTMVPASVRADGDEAELGNRISFLFVGLPCDEPDPVARLRGVHEATRFRKETGEPEAANAVMDLASYAPSAVQRLLTRLAASPRSFNLAVSNIPGPAEPLYMLGCPLREAYPVVPLADRHALSIGFTSVAGEGFFGVYADPDALPDADELAEGLAESLDELLELAVRPAGEAAPVT